MKPVIWLHEAAQDLKIIGSYIAQENPKAAYEVLVKIKTAADSLSYNPEIGRVGRVVGTRELIISSIPYILAYIVTKQNIQILAVLHTSRKWPDDFENLQ